VSRLDETRLEKVRRGGERIICRCPACFEQGHDKTGNHLSIWTSGAFACVQFPGDEGIEHRKRIFELVGVRDESGPRTFPTLNDAIGFMVQKLSMRATRRDIYHDAGGKVHFVVVRFDSTEEKEFRPFHQTADGWVIGDPPGELPLFGLPELLVPDLNPSSEPVIVVEGEKCVCALEELGLLATTSAHGAQGARKTHWEPLSGRNVVILPDNDSDGRDQYARTVTALLLKLSPQAKVKIVELPGLPPKGDCVEWIEARNGKPPEEIRAELLELARKAETVREACQATEPNDEDATIARLAALSLIEYERCREAKAEKLGCRKSILDFLVNAKRLLTRPPGEGDNLQGTAVRLVDVEPWPEPVNGAEVLDAIAHRFDHYAVLPDGAGDTQALWCTHTHLFKLFQKSPRLYISAPTEECGKSTLLNCTSLFCARAKRADNMSTAVMFRLAAGHSPTILVDECDKWLFTNGELVGLVQSGHEKGGTVMRCEGDSNDLREFGCYAPFALAAIGKLPSQLHSRSICIRLKRARKEEIKQRSVFDFEHVEYETELNRKLARWILDNRERIASCNPKLPEHLFNRIADNWRPLFKIAEVAGGDWPRRCADALVKLTTGEDERENLRVMLLVDIREVFKTERIFSKDLVEKLAELKERPWPEICRGKPITAQWLARNLAAFGIHSGNIRIGEEQAKGYERAQFDDVFARYVPETQEGGISPVPPSHSEVKPEILAVPKDEVGTGEKTAVYEALGRWDGSPTGEGPRKGRI
jgi:hypothetical protein